MVDTKLRTLLTLIDIQSYTKTAQILSLTQPAVSQHIRNLENEYKIKIFYKGTKILKLTPEGEVLAKYAHRELAMHKNLLNDLEAYQNGIQRYTLGITPSAEENLVPHIIGKYCYEHPDVKFTVVTDSIKNLCKKLNNYEVDFAFVEGSCDEPGLISLTLDTDHLCAIVSPDHPLASRESVSMEELRQERMIMRPSSAGTSKMLEQFLAAHSDSIKNYRVMMEIDNVSTIKDLVQNNLGISIVAHSACSVEEKSGKLRVLPIQDFSATRDINLVYRSDFKHTQIFDDLCQMYRKF